MNKKYKSAEEMFDEEIRPFLPDDTETYQDQGLIGRIKLYLMWRNAFK